MGASVRFYRLCGFELLYGGARPARDFPLLARLYLDGKLFLDELITRHIKLDEINEGFAALKAGEAIRSVVMF